MIRKLEDIKPRVLVVDDDHTVGELIADYLNEKDYDVFYVDDGEEALNYVKRVRPHVILLDVRMASKDGLEVLTQVLVIDPKVGVIMVTGVRDEDTGRRALELGAADYLLKPIDLEFLDTNLQFKISAMLE